MDQGALGLALIPPTMALILEAVNPLSDNKVRRDVERDLDGDLQSSALRLEIRQKVTDATAAAVEMAGLAPTVVASVTSGFAVIHDLEHPFWYAVCYTLIFIAVVIFIICVLGGASLLEVARVKVRFSFVGGLGIFAVADNKPGLTRQNIVKSAIYLSNLLLVVAALSVFFATNHSLVASSEGGH